MHRVPGSFGVPVVLLSTLLFLGCAQACSPQKQGRIVLMSYNVHNLFDARDAGTEYPEFSVKAGRWNEAKYKARLEALARVVRAAAPEAKGPDLVCLMEVENQGILEELRTGSLASSGYLVSALVPSPGQAVNCGILSRYPIRELRAHGLKARSRGGRLILEAHLDLGEADLVVFVNHWKSKIEGPEATEGERREAAALLSDRIADLLAQDPELELLACGDFNEGPTEYLAVDRAWPTALMPVSEAASEQGGAPGNCLYVAMEKAQAGILEGGRPALYSPWATSTGWSYINKGEKERLDGFLLGPGLLDSRGLSLSDFYSLEADFLLDGEGRPLSYNPSRGLGYSDHLPLVLELTSIPGAGGNSSPRKPRLHSPG